MKVANWGSLKHPRSAIEVSRQVGLSNIPTSGTLKQAKHKAKRGNWAYKKENRRPINCIKDELDLIKTLLAMGENNKAQEIIRKVELLTEITKLEG